MFDINTMPLVPADKGITERISVYKTERAKSKYLTAWAYIARNFPSKSAKKYYFVFLGVSSCLQLYVNGFYIGYAEGSHNTHEFDITQYLNEDSDDNELVVLVYKWCNGTYLECQDMFRNNGIFRDVYVTLPRFIYLGF